MLGQALLRVAAERGDAPAMIHGGRVVSYRHYADEALRWASVLAPLVTIRRAHPVAIQLPNGPDYALVLTALALLDVPLLPVHPQWSSMEVIRALGGRPLSAVITSKGNLESWHVDALHPVTLLLGLEDLRAEAETAAPLEVPLSQLESADREALCLMTSGTLGAPKLVVRSQGNILANAHQVGLVLGWGAGTRVLPVTPFHHANGISNGLILPLLRGACIVILPQYFPATFAVMVREHRVDVIVASPVVYASILASSDAGSALSLVRQAISSGAPLPIEVAAGLAARWQVQVRELYGSSETGTISIEPIRSERLLHSVGIPLPGVDIAILSDVGQPVPPGTQGLVAVRSAAVMAGYWSPQGLVDARDCAGMYHTGDVGMLDDKGGLRLYGRRRKFINIGGNKVNPREIEAILDALPSVSRNLVYSEPHPQTG